MLIALLATLILSVSAQDFDAANYLLLNTATTTSPSSPQPTLEECGFEAQQLSFSDNTFYVVRLNQFDFREAPRGVFLVAYLCEDLNERRCLRLKRSNTSTKTPISLGLLPDEIACNIASQKRRDIELKYLNIRIIKQNLLTSEQVFTSFTSLKHLQKTHRAQTAYSGELLLFPAPWPQSNIKK